jgi:hypothetical protein
MPKIYRSMKEEDDGKPVVDATGKGLGVRGMPVNNITDVDLDSNGKVILNGKGMSVASTWRDLAPHLVSKRLQDKLPKARGSVQLRCFTMGDGPFQHGPMADGLDFKRDTARHGLIVPNSSVTLDQFQDDLANTRDRWVIDEA